MDSTDTLHDCIEMFCNARAFNKGDETLNDCRKGYEIELVALRERIPSSLKIPLEDLNDCMEKMLIEQSKMAYKQGIVDGVKILEMLEGFKDPPPSPCKKCSGHLER